jgi:acyl-CoA thioesterase FadM
MNLWLRLLWLVASALWRPRLAVPFAVSRLGFRVWPHDLDTSLHMNNGRYWTIMDLGRADLMIRSGLWRAVLRQGWTPVVSAGQIRFRRELRPFQAFHLETRLLFWDERRLVMEHRMLTAGDTVAAVALVQAGLYDRRARTFVPVARLLQLVGAHAESPAATPEIEAFLMAEGALRQTTASA